MKRHVLRFVLAGVLVAAPFAPAFAGVSVMTDEDLGAVSARGFEAVAGISGDQNNFNSVQLGGSAQSGTSGLALYNVLFSNVNVSQNVTSLSGVWDVHASVGGYQDAENSAGGTDFTAWNGSSVQGQSNNVTSLQLGGSGQAGASALAVLNVSYGAPNISQNLTNMDKAYDTDLYAKSTQQGNYSGSSEQYLTNWKRVKDQSNNNGSVQLGDNAQKGISGLAVLNTVVSAANIGQNLASLKDTDDIHISQVNCQKAYNDGFDEQIIKNYGKVATQTNNNGSVQAGGNAQEGIKALVAANVAVSAVNIGQNMLFAADSDDLSAKQKNDQYAANYVETSQKIKNKEDVSHQYNNNSSVQLGGLAQSSAGTTVLANVANSAVNIGQNLLGDADPAGKGSYYSQKNYQGAFGGELLVGITSLDDELVGNEQKVKNKDEVRYQSNNNGSVQAGDDAQKGAKSAAIVNATLSALNIGQNIADIKGWQELTKLYQKNGQEAENFFYVSQTVKNKEDVDHQNNNASSVQLADNAQQGANALVLANVAGSAVNVGQNIANMEGHDARLSQKNYQYAESFGDSEQYVTNKDEVKYQNNNDSSVQILGAQGSARGMSLVNAAFSAVNVGQNLADVSAKGDASLKQKNEQQAGTGAVAPYGLDVESYDRVRYQNNNAESVQLMDGQNGASGVSILNAADTLVNVGQNVASVSATKEAEVKQVNEQFAQAAVMVLGYVAAKGSADSNTNYDSVWGYDSQNRAAAVSLANLAGSAANIGQNLLTVEAKEAEFVQLNAQGAKLGGQEEDVSGTGLIVAYKDVKNQTNSNGSVYLDGSQNWASGLSILNAALSGVNAGQNIAKVNACCDAQFAQINLQEAEAYAAGDMTVTNEDVKGQTNNNGSVQLTGTGSQNGVRALSLANIAGSGANIGQNIANVDAYEAAFLQVNAQKAKVDSLFAQDVTNGAAPDDDPPVIGGKVNGQVNNNGSVLVDGSQNNVRAVSLANIAGSAVNIGQNIAAVRGKETLFAQVNLQKAEADTASLQDVESGYAKYQTNDNGSVQLVNSQNSAKALSIANIAGSAANIGQNIAKVDASYGASVIQANKQCAEADAEADQNITAGKASYLTNNNGSLDLTGSQNGLSSLSVLNAALSAVNVGQNIAYITGKDVYVNQVNCQEAYADSYAGQNVFPAGSKGSQSNNSSIVLDGAQMNTRALSIANVVGSAVNIGQNIACITGAKGAGIYQMNFQLAGR